MNRTLKRLGLVVATLTSATVLSGIPPTTDIPLPGAKMQLADTSGRAGRRNFVLLRDGDDSVALPDPGVTGATVSIGRVGAGEVTVLDLPASGWSGGPQDFKFKSQAGTVIGARLKASPSFRLSARGDGAYPLGGAPQGGVGIIVDVGGVRFCGFFGGTIVKDDGERFRARKSPAPAGCPILGTTTTTSTTSSTTTSSTMTSSTTTSSTTTTATTTTVPGDSDCLTQPDGTPCHVDGDLCSLDTCAGGQCVSTGVKKVCDAPPPACVARACNPATGACDPTQEPVNEGQSCEDIFGGGETFGDCQVSRCSSGTCSPTPDCRDDLGGENDCCTADTPCTVSTCATSGQCEPVPRECPHEQCKVNTGCEEPGGCTYRECVSGEGCLDGACCRGVRIQPINGCSSDSDCVIQGTRCFAGTCFDVDCGNGGDPVSLVGCSIKGGGGTCQTCDGVTCDTICGCPTGQQCFANRCVVNGGCGLPCSSDTDCTGLPCDKCQGASPSSKICTKIADIEGQCGRACTPGGAPCPAACPTCGFTGTCDVTIPAGGDQWCDPDDDADEDGTKNANDPCICSPSECCRFPTCTDTVSGRSWCCP